MTGSARQEDILRWRAHLQAEADGIAIYPAMALRDAGAWIKVPRPSWRAHVLVFVARRFGARWVTATVAGREAKDQAGYDDQPEAAGTSQPRDPARCSPRRS